MTDSGLSADLRHDPRPWVELCGRALPAGSQLDQGDQGGHVTQGAGLLEQDRCSERYDAAIGTASEISAYARLRERVLGRGG